MKSRFDGNVLRILKFMGGYLAFNNKWAFYQDDDEKFPNENNGFDSSILLSNPYRNSWEWLMEVVKEIESNGHMVHIAGNNVVIKENMTISSPSIVNHTKNSFSMDKKKAIYNAVIEYLDWYEKK